MDSSNHEMLEMMEELNLESIEFEDVMHLYRGWRKAENGLRDKVREVNLLRERLQKQDEMIGQQRGRIKALESVAELAGNLQVQIATLTQENLRVTEQNRELAEINISAETLLHDKISGEYNQHETVKSLRSELMILQGRYDESYETRKHLESLLNNEQLTREKLNLEVKSQYESMDTLREENKSLRIRVDSLTQKNRQCDRDLEHAMEQLNTLSRDISNMRKRKDEVSTAEAEVELLKADIGRLMKLLQHYPSSSYFLRCWQEESQGLSYVGKVSSSSSFNRTNQTIFDFDNISEYSRGNKSHILDNFEESWDITANELSQMKRLYEDGNEPIPSSFDDESELWVSREYLNLGMGFFKEFAPHAPISVVKDFIRKMNKIWLRREKRRMAQQKEIYERQIHDLKRQISHHQPYKKVIADHEITYLHKQVKKERQKVSRLRTKSAEPRDFFETDDLESIDSSSKVASKFLRPCQTDHTPEKRRENVQSTSAKKLLEVSLHNLDRLGKNMLSAESKMHNFVSNIETFPTIDYIQGATWLGRNIAVLMEDLYHCIDDLRSKQIAEISAITIDKDLKRCTFRLQTLLTSSLTEAKTLCEDMSNKANRIIQQASRLTPGNLDTFESFANYLPIDAVLRTPSKNVRG